MLMRRNRLLLLMMVLLLTVRSAVGAIAQPIMVERLEQQTEAGVIRGWVAKVDVRDPKVEVVVTGARVKGHGHANISANVNDKVNDNHTNQPALKGSASTTESEAVLLPTDVWAKQVGVVLAINANYFARQGDGTADIIGLSVSDGVVVSPVRVYQGVADPALVIDKQGTIHVGLMNAAQWEGAWLAVAGVGASASDPERGGLLVHEGRNQGKQARVEPLTRHPRTAIGTDVQGRWLIMVVIDGRQPGWSIGATLEETAAILIEYGATHAINLDGGGSTSFYMNPKLWGTARERWGDEVVTNRPSDGVFRPVANHLGVRWRKIDVNESKGIQP